MSTNKPFVIIGIPTFRRPKGLRRLLESLAKQTADFPLHILVADNEGEGGVGLNVVEEVCAEGFPFPLTAITVPERGISQARNALMAEGFGTLNGDALAMVDDDEWVDPRWIASLVAMQKATGADVVGARVLPDFGGEAPAWSYGLSVYWRAPQPPGPCELVPNTGGTLFSRSIATGFKTHLFDPRFSLTGGEDNEFLRRVKQEGARFAYAPEAIAHELIGTDRATRRWALRRAFRIGNSIIRIEKAYARGAKPWLLETAKILAGLVVPIFAVPMMAFWPARQMGFALMFARQIGKLSAFMKLYATEYKATHGA